MGYRNAANVLPPDLLDRIQNFHTGMLWVPKVDKEFYERRNRRIMQLKQSGLTNARIAREEGLSKRQVARIISFARNGAVSAIYTGMRKGELIHLEWADVDIKNATITGY